MGAAVGYLDKFTPDSRFFDTGGLERLQGVTKEAAHMSEDRNKWPYTEQRHARPRMSLGGIASLLAIIVTLIGGVHYFDSVITKLDDVATQVTSLGDVKTDVAKLQTRMDRLEEWIRRLADTKTAPIKGD